MNSPLDRILTQERAQRRHAKLDQIAAMQRRLDDALVETLPDDLRAMLSELNTLVWEILHDRTLH
jgi:hypothetical protein